MLQLIRRLLLLIIKKISQLNFCLVLRGLRQAKRMKFLDAFILLHLTHNSGLLRRTMEMVKDWE